MNKYFVEEPIMQNLTMTKINMNEIIIAKIKMIKTIMAK
jgi:hypothetical protein